MSDETLETGIVDWVIEHPESVAVFERYGIDYCCGGKSLEYACLQRGADPQIVLNELRQLMADRGCHNNE